MNYLDKMHLGDIVIFDSGSIGYVCVIDYEDDFFECTMVRDANKDVDPCKIIYHIPENEIPIMLTQIGARKIEPQVTDKCADCNRDYDTDDRLDTLNSNLITLIDKLDEIINSD